MRKQCLLALAAMSVVTGCVSESPSSTEGGRAQAASTASAPVHASGAAPSCPGKDFAGFLRAFGSDARVRRAHTAPMIDVTDWIDVDEPERGTAVERIPREAYRGFTLRRHANRYVHVQHDDMPEPIPVEPRVTAVPAGYRVEYIFNMSEGNSWTFARTRDCWQLVADPDPSLL